MECDNKGGSSWVQVLCLNLGSHRDAVAERCALSKFGIGHQDTSKCLFYILLTVNFDIILDNEQLDTCFILQYIYYNPLHVSSIICSSSGGGIVLMLHLVSSLSVSGRPVLVLFYNTFIIILYMFRAFYAHHQEVEFY